MFKLSNFKLNKKRIIPIATSVVAIGLCVGILISSARSTMDFQPPTVMDSSVKINKAENVAFDGRQSSDEGLSIKQNSKKDTQLDKGNDTTLHNNKNSGTGDIAVSDGTTTDSNSSETGVGLNIGNDNNNSNIIIGGNSNDESPTTPQGGGQNNGNGNGNGNGDGDGGNGDNGNQNNDNPTQPTTPKDDYDSDKDLSHDAGSESYDDDEDESTKNEDSSVTDEEYKTNTVRIVNVTPLSSDKIYFYPGYQPTSSVMASYISVSAVISSSTNATSTVKSDLKYSYKNDRNTYGGDYYIDWDTKSDDVQNKVATTPGDYTAEIFIVNPSTDFATVSRTTLEYTVVDLRLQLLDFDEDFDSFGDKAFIQTAHAKGSNIINLSSNISAMNDKILQRTNSGLDYKHKFKETASGSFSQYFGGWTLSDGTIVGTSYTIRNLEIDKLKTDGDTTYYELELTPLWVNLETVADRYNIRINDMGLMELYGFSGTHSALKTLDVPDGIAVLNLEEFAKDTFSSLSLINVSASVSQITFPQNMSSFPALAAFGVADDNKHFMDVAGILYDKTGHTLYKVPNTLKEISSWSKYVDSIGGYAFSGVTIDTLTLPSTLTTVEENAFTNANIKKLRFTTDSVLTVGKNAFATDGMISISQIIVNDTVDDKLYLDDLCALSIALNDDNIENYNAVAKALIDTESGITLDYEYVDGWILSDNNTVLLYSSSSIGETATIPIGVTTIKANALKNCLSLKELTLPTTITTLMDDSLNCKTLNSVYFTGADAPTIGNKGMLFGEKLSENIHVYVPGESFNLYYDKWSPSDKDGYGEGTTDTILMPHGNGIETINGAIYWRKSPNEYVLLDGTKVSGAFVVDKNTTEIRKDAFRHNDAITSIIITSNLSNIGSYAFYDCAFLKSVTINGSVEKIADHAFDKCSSLDTFIWGNINAVNTLKSIGIGAFMETALTGLPNDTIGCVSISNNNDLSKFNSCVVFEGIDSSTGEDLFTSLKSIGDYAFAYCYNYSKASIPLGLSYGGYHTWNDLVSNKFELTWFLLSNTTPVGSADNAPSFNEIPDRYIKNEDYDDGNGKQPHGK